MKKLFIPVFCLMLCILSVKIMADELNHIYVGVVSYAIKVNEKTINLKNNILYFDGVTYLPIRELSNILGCSVNWDAEKEEISIKENYPYTNMPIRFQDENTKKYGYKDKNGKIVIEAKFDKASDFSDGAAMGLADNKIMFFNTKGNCMAEFDNDYYDVFIDEGFSEGCCALSKFKYQIGRTGENFATIVYVDPMGNQVIDKEFEELSENFHEGYAVSRKGGRYFSPVPITVGYIDKTGEFVNDEAYKEASDFVNGYAKVVTLDGQSGKIDRNFNFYPDAE